MGLYGIIKRSGYVIAGLALMFSSVSMATVIDDFESYADDAALQSVWTSPVGNQAMLETNSVYAGSQSMRVLAEWVNPFVQVNTLSFSSAQDWSTGTSAHIKYLGSAGNGAITITMRLMNGGIIVVQEAISNTGTDPNNWQTLTVPLAGQTDLTNITSVIIFMSPNPSSPSTIYFDELTVDFPSASPDVTVTETGGSTDVAEGGATDSISVSIASMPTHNVVVTPSFNTDQLDVTPASRTITPAGWESSVSFTIAADDDDDIEGTHTSGVSFSTASTDSNYDGINTSNRTVNISDNDFLVTPIMTDVSYDGTNMYISFTTEHNQQYTVQKISDLTATNWTVSNGPFPGLIGPIVDLPLPANSTQQFYRVSSEPYP